MKDICIIQNHSPTLLVDIGTALGQSDVNIEGLSLSSIGDQAVVHLLVCNEELAVTVLANSGIQIATVSDVFVLDKDAQNVTGQSGSFGQICHALVDAGLSINFGYPAENNRFVFGVSDVDEANRILAQAN